MQKLKVPEKADKKKRTEFFFFTKKEAGAGLIDRAEQKRRENSVK